MTGQVEGVPRPSPSKPGQALSGRGALGEQRAPGPGRLRQADGRWRHRGGSRGRKLPEGAWPFTSVNDLLRDKSLGNSSFEGVDEATDGEKSQCLGNHHTDGPGGDGGDGELQEELKRQRGVRGGGREGVLGSGEEWAQGGAATSRGVRDTLISHPHLLGSLQRPVNGRGSRRPWAEELRDARRGPQTRPRAHIRQRRLRGLLPLTSALSPEPRPRPPDTPHTLSSKPAPHHFPLTGPA